MILKSELEYKGQKISKGYANRTLYVNLSRNEIKIKPVTEEMKKRFIGGKGFDLWLMWNALPKDRRPKWNDAENEICIASGPLGGTTYYPGSGKSIVTTISPLTDIIIDSNVGGYFGPYLKFSGFDALEIQGKAEKEVIIYIDGVLNKIQIQELSSVDEFSLYSHELTQELTKDYGELNGKYSQISVVSTGPASKHSRWGMLNFSWYSKLREWASYKQAGRGGVGTVFSDKNIRALICRGPKVTIDSNHPARLEEARNIGKKHSQEIVKNDPIQNEMRRVGTGHLPEIMNTTDLLPVENFRFGSHPTLTGTGFPYTREKFRDVYMVKEGADGCWIGCTVSCSHYSENHIVLTGPFKGQKVIVDGPEYETIAGCGSNWGVWDIKWVLEANFYCDTYGLDTISVGTGIAFIMECFELGILNEKGTGDLELKFGNAEAALELIHQIARGEGFGRIVGKGIKYMKDYFVKEFGANSEILQDIGMEHKGLEFSEYVTKESLAQQGGYGLTNKGPQHDEAWLIFEDMVRNSIPSFEDKAVALSSFPFWRTWFALQGLCKLPWNDIVPLDNKDNPIKDEHTGELIRAMIPKHLEWYAQYYSSVTGKTSSVKNLLKDSERVYNFQRIFNIRLGKGLREHDSILPYRAMGPVTKREYESRQERYDQQIKEKIGVDPALKTIEEKMDILKAYRVRQYELLQDAVYKARGWNEGGCPTIKKIKELGIDYEDIINIIKPYQ